VCGATCRGAGSTPSSTSSGWRKGAASLRERQQLLRMHRELIEQRMTDLGHALEVVDSKIEFYAKWLRTGVQPPLPRIQKGSKQS
jgi:hypothetical protein